MATLKTRKKVFTAAEAGLTSSQAKKLVAEGVLEIVGTRKTGLRGRPATEYSKV